MSALAPARHQLDKEHALEPQVDVGRHGAGVDAAVETVHGVGAHEFGVGLDKRPQVDRPDLLLALGKELDAHGQLAARLQPRLGPLHKGQHARLVVGGAAPPQPALVHHGAKGRIGPLLHRLRRLHVVVRIGQQRLAARGAGHVADDAGRPAVKFVGGGRQPVGVHHLDHEVRALVEPDPLGADARLLHQLLQVGDRFVHVLVDPRKGGLQFGRNVGHRCTPVLLVIYSRGRVRGCRGTFL